MAAHPLVNFHHPAHFGALLLWGSLLYVIARCRSLKPMELHVFRAVFKARSMIIAPTIIAAALICFSPRPVSAQRVDPVAPPVVVQPGAPGQPTRVLPSTTRAKLLSASPKDVEFMQGMIHHHAQAVEMTDMIESRTENRDIRLIGERISKSQSDEIAFMKRWLERRGQPVEMKMSQEDHHGAAKVSNAPAHGHEPSKVATQDTPHLMPGMLTPQQMDALRKAKGAEFDRLFLTGMIQHHNGALVMVKDLFDSPGSGQDAELFTFATDVDSGQRAEINSLRTLLDKKP
jgi:uncharacterized protein (DUF305 family)